MSNGTLTMQALSLKLKQIYLVSFGEVASILLTLLWRCLGPLSITVIEYPRPGHLESRGVYGTRGSDSRGWEVQGSGGSICLGIWSGMFASS